MDNRKFGNMMAVSLIFSSDLPASVEIFGLFFGIFQYSFT